MFAPMPAQYMQQPFVNPFPSGIDEYNYQTGGYGGRSRGGYGGGHGGVSTPRSFVQCTQSIRP